MTTKAPHPARLAALHNRDFSIYITARFLATIAWQMMDVGVGWHVYQLSRDPLDLGFVGLAQFIPFVLLVIPAGHVADRFNRIQVLRAAYFVGAMSVGTLLGLTMSGSQDVRYLLGAVVIFGAARAFFMPAIQAMVRNLVPQDIFPSAVALNSSVSQIAVICGPALGGLLYLAGAGILFATVLGLLVFTIALLGFVRPVLSQGNGTSGGMQEVLEGLRFVLHRRIILGAISLDLFAVLFGGVTALLPLFASDILHVGSPGLGALRAAPAIGAALTAATLAFRPIRGHPGLWMFGGIAAYGVATVTFGLSASFWVSLGALLLIGGGDMLSVFVRQTLVQLQTPDRIRGRVSAVTSLFIGASNELGGFESGLAARLFGPVIAVVGGGVATLLVVAAFLRLFPQFRALRTLDQAAMPPDPVGSEA
jgi:MFS family permease